MLEWVLTKLYRLSNRRNMRECQYSPTLNKLIATTLLGHSFKTESPINYSIKGDYQVWTCGGHSVTYSRQTRVFVINNKSCAGKRPSTKVINLLEDIACGKEHTSRLQMVVVEETQG